MNSVSLSSSRSHGCVARPLFAALGMFVLGASATRGDVIQYHYQGVVTQAAAGSGIAPGTAFTGSIAYDPALKTPSLVIEGHNQYEYGNGSPGASGLTLAVGGTPLVIDSGHLVLGVSETEYAGQFGYSPSPATAVSLSSGSNGPLAVSLSLSNPNRSVFGSLAPPGTLSLADFPSAQLTVDSRSPTTGVVTSLFQGTIESLVPFQAKPVPEPSGLLVFGLAIAGWGAWGLRRTRDQ